MERFLKKYDRECMKMAMLKHEETFRYQVHELHRLYQVQKLLMKDELKRHQMSAGSGTHRRTLDLELPAEEYIGIDGGDSTMEIEGEGDLELTLAIGSSGRKKKDASFTSDSAGSFSSSSAESEFQGGFGTGIGRTMASFQSERMSGFEGEEHMREERVKHPPWLFQCLSLNMT